MSLASQFRKAWGGMTVTEIPDPYDILAPAKVILRKPNGDTKTVRCKSYVELFDICKDFAGDSAQLKKIRGVEEREASDASQTNEPQLTKGN